MARVQRTDRRRKTASVWDVWQAICRRKEIDPAEAIGRLVGWFAGEDSLLQSIILGQIEVRDLGRVSQLVHESVTIRRIQAAERQWVAEGEDLKNFYGSITETELDLVRRGPRVPSPPGTALGEIEKNLARRAADFEKWERATGKKRGRGARRTARPGP